MSKLAVTMAVGPYDHVRDLATGEVAVEGVDLNFLRLPTLEIFHRFTHRREFDVAEMSFGRYISLFSQDAPIIAIPVFPSRLFRLASIFVPAGGCVAQPQDLAGKRVAVPEWSQTATIYVRGWLQHQIGVDLRGIRWFTAGNHGANPHGEQVALKLPKGIEITHVGDRSIGDLLVEGGVDAVFAAGAPHQFLAGDRRITRLFPDFRAAEEAYHRTTGIFPIMHVICLRRDLAERNPWLAMNLLKAFEQAKRNSLARLADEGMSYYAVPWLTAQVRAIVSEFGEDFWPYGVSPNRATLDAFTRYAVEQGVSHKELGASDLFDAGARELSSSYGRL